MPRSSSVSEKVWAQAIHAVTVQKMSLRRAAQLYGVHHMSLHRRVRGRYMTNQPSRFDDFRLTAPEEQEALLVLREQFFHEGLVSADDVRYVVRTIASQDGRREIPSDFPLNRWISNFKRVHNLSSPSSPQLSAATTPVATPPPPPLLAQAPMPATSMFKMPAKFMTPSLTGSGHTTSSTSGSTGVSSHSPTARMSSRYQYYPRSDSNEHADSTSESESEHHRESHEREERRIASSTNNTNGIVNHKRSATAAAVGGGEDEEGNAKVSCKQSNLVTPETWEKAMDAVEIHGMSLRTAAKAFGVHFAALHRRVKKRALKKDQAPPLENYIPFEDEAGIVRVIHARADLGILLGFDELVDLLNRTTMKYTMVTPDLSRSIVRRFQSRVEQSIRHLIKDWPLPRLDSIYRYHPVGEEKMAVSPTMSTPPHLPTLFPRNHSMASEPKPLNSHRLQHHHQQHMQSPMAQHQDAYARAYHRDSDGDQMSPMEIVQSPRASTLRL